MEEKIIDSMSETLLSPEDYITIMFERTDEDGILYIPGWHYDGPGSTVGADGSTDEERSYRCRVDWNIRKYEGILTEFKKLFSAIKAISKDLYALNHCQNPKEILKDLQLLEIWEKYLSPIATGDFDQQRYNQIHNKLDTVAEVKYIAEKLAKGEKLLDFEKQMLAEYMDMEVTLEEIKYRRDFIEHIHKEAEQRIGENICAYDVIIRARRVCYLFHLNAPESVIFTEARQLAAALVLHKYGISRELVENTIRLRLEQMEQMSEEELDEFFRPQKSNSRKSLAPLFVYEILKNHSHSKLHLRQNDILKLLSQYPYEISLERKALSRILHNLTDSSQYAVFQDKSGVWMDRQEQTKN